MIWMALWLLRGVNCDGTCDADLNCKGSCDDYLKAGALQSTSDTSQTHPRDARWVPRKPCVKRFALQARTRGDPTTRRARRGSSARARTATSARATNVVDIYIRSQTRAISLRSTRHPSNADLHQNWAVALASSAAHEGAGRAQWREAEAAISRRPSLSAPFSRTNEQATLFSSNTQVARLSKRLGHRAADALLEMIAAHSVSDGAAPDRFERCVAAERALLRRDDATALALVCDDVVLVPESVDGALSAAERFVAAVTLEACGVVALAPSRAALDLVDSAAQAVARHDAERSSSSQSALLSGAAQSREHAERGAGGCRVEASLSPRRDPAVAAVVGCELVSQLAATFLRSDRVELDALSYVRARPGCGAQPWHVDVGNLGREDTFGVVLVVPLVDVDAANGATEFVPGSHRPSFKAAGPDQDEDDFAGRTLQPALRRGSTLFFDLRTRHRGGAHRGDELAAENRAIIYASFVLDSFHDAINLHEPQSDWWDSLHDDRQRKLYTRLDSRDYVRRLEEALLAAGRPLPTSQRDYRRDKLRI